MEKHEKDEKLKHGEGFKNNKHFRDDGPYQRVLDTIPEEEMEKARNAFKQYKFTDNVNSNLVLDYNLFIPEN